MPGTTVSDVPRTITAVFATPATVTLGQNFALAITVEAGQSFVVDLHDPGAGVGPVFQTFVHV
jgi:hypothetical protein